jgi:large subunit ribosomal protein L24
MAGSAKSAGKSKQAAKVSTSLKKGDPVIVIAGGNKKKRPLKGQVAKIKAIVGDKCDRVLLEGLNVFVKHQKATAPGQTAGKIQVEQSVHISNVMYYVEDLKRPVRLSSAPSTDGKKRVRGYKDPTTKKFVEIAAK